MSKSIQLDDKLVKLEESKPQSMVDISLLLSVKVSTHKKIEDKTFTDPKPQKANFSICFLHIKRFRFKT